MNFADAMPAEARTGVFDMAVYQFAQKLDRARFTKQISFSTHARVRRDITDPNKVLLHGFMQQKDRFIEQCLTPLSDSELSRASWNPLLDRIEDARRKLRVQFVRKGHRAMLENMFLAKKKYESENPNAFYKPRNAA